MYEMSRVVEKSNIQNSVNSMGNCVHYMYGMSGFAENLNIQNYVNSTVYLVHKCRECLDLQKSWMSRTEKIQQEIVYSLYVRNVWICRNIEYPKLRKFNGKLYTLYVRNIWICKKFDYPEQRKFNGKLCTFYVRNVWICRKLNIQNCKNSTGNCVHYISSERLDLHKN